MTDKNIVLCETDNREELVKYFKYGIKENGPFLIEVLI